MRDNTFIALFPPSVRQDEWAELRPEVEPSTWTAEPPHIAMTCPALIIIAALSSFACAVIFPRLQIRCGFFDEAEHF